MQRLAALPRDRAGFEGSWNAALTAVLVRFVVLLVFVLVPVACACDFFTREPGEAKDLDPLGTAIMIRPLVPDSLEIEWPGEPLPEEGPGRLEMIKERVGELLVPTYLPGDLSLATSQIMRGSETSLTYSASFDSERGVSLPIVRILQVTGAVIPATVPSRYVRSVEVAGRRGYILRGAEVEPDDSDEERSWDPTAALTLYLPQERFVTVIGPFPTDVYDDEELVRIAESLEPL